MAEMIGMLGTSGFVGMSLGPILGDLLLDVPHLSRVHVDRMFLVAAAMCVVSLLFAALATRRERTYRARRHPPLIYLVRRYHPGTILLVGMAMGLGLGLPHTFLRTYTAQLNIGRMKVFFLVYAAAAFMVRVGTRRLADRWGVRPAIHLGLNALAATMVLFLAVRSEWMLAIPAVTGGGAHALLFPAVVAGTNTRFPRRYRGLATSLIMAMFDLGNLIGPPVVGGIIDLAKPLGLPPYGTMFLSVAAAMVAVSLIYGGGSTRTGE
jgi:MFS family permease